MKHISYPKIEQFRNIVSNIKRNHSFVGLDENQEPIYDNTIPMPTILFRGTIKLHGTNASVCYNLKDGYWIQSRNGIITPQKDNAGFAFFADVHEEEFKEIIGKVVDTEGISLISNTLSIYGEWVGKSIQKGVGISEIEKSFFIFGIKVTPHNEDKAYWVDSSYIRSKEHRIYNISDFKTYEVEVDFNYPAKSQNKFIEITEEVEKECPVAKEFGISGVGEGVVWSAEHKGIVYRFKVKGEKHSSSKVKKLASVDVEKLNSIEEFVNYAVTESRYNQAIENTFRNEEKDVKKLGDLLRWMVNDIIKEESDTLSKNGLEPKDVNKYISAKTKEYFFNDLKL